VENSIEEILNQSWSRVPTDLFIRLHWERPLEYRKKFPYLLRSILRNIDELRW